MKRDPVERNVAPRLQALRERAGYSVREFAKAAGLPHGTYSAYEGSRRGKSSIPMDKLSAWAPLLIGKGEPPISVDDVLSLGDQLPEGRAPIAQNQWGHVDEYLRGLTEARDICLQAPFAYSFSSAAEIQKVIDAHEQINADSQPSTKAKLP